jgi:hypothetical protein
MDMALIYTYAVDKKEDEERIGGTVDWHTGTKNLMAFFYVMGDGLDLQSFVFSRIELYWVIS